LVIQPFTIFSVVSHEGKTMASLTNALQQLRAERQVAQLQVEKLDQAISVIESLNGTGVSRKSARPTRIVSAASRRKMAQAQKARRDPVGYFEQVTRQSSIIRVSLTSPSPIPEYLAQGEQPKISSDGRRFAFIREQDEKTSVWLSEPQFPKTAQLMINGAPSILELSVTSEGDLIAAAGPVSAPHLIIVRRLTGVVEALPGIEGPVRYPAISLDGKRLAFSRREWGSWQLVVRELATGVEQQLTHAACNATLPAWEDTHTLLYATDCGRGLGLSALARVTLPN
jgi:dipeptidyl aminopeptidase/acylaminoacyl peptidase